MTLELIAHTPWRGIVYFQVHGESVAIESISTQFPNLTGMHFERLPLPAAFPKVNPDGDGEIFGCLQYILLDRVFVGIEDWGPPIAFLLWCVPREPTSFTHDCRFLSRVAGYYPGGGSRA